MKMVSGNLLCSTVMKKKKEKRDFFKAKMVVSECLLLECCDPQFHLF